MLNGYTCNDMFLCWKSERCLTCFCALLLMNDPKNGWDLALNQRNTLQGTDTYPTKREVRKTFAPWGSPLVSPSGKKSGLNLLICSIQNYRYPYTPPEFQHGYPIWKEIYCLGYPCLNFQNVNVEKTLSKKPSHPEFLRLFAPFLEDEILKL